MSRYLAGFDVGGTDVKFGIVKSDGTLVYKTSYKTPYGRLDKLIRTMCSQIEKLPSEYSPASLGIGCAGYVNPQAGVVTEADNLGMPEIRFKEKLEQRLGIPVKVENDVQAALNAECLCGTGRNVENIVYVALGTGVGGAYLLDGRFYRGCGNGGAEIGHMIIHRGGRKCSCGMRGCYEKYASISALVRDCRRAYRANRRKEEAETADGKTIFAALRNNDSLTWEVYNKYLENICTGLISLMNLFAPEMIIIGGALSNEGSYFAGHIKAALGKHETYSKYFARIEVVPAALGNTAGIIGAALL